MHFWLFSPRRGSYFLCLGNLHRILYRMPDRMKKPAPLPTCTGYTASIGVTGQDTGHTGGR